MKYKVLKGCQWRDFTAYQVTGDIVRSKLPPGVVQLDVLLGADDLKTGDGKPLPAEVVEHFVRSGCLAPCDDAGNPLEVPA